MIRTKEKFFKNPSKIDEITVDEHLDIFRESAAITENYFKLIYGIKHNYNTDQEIEKLEKAKFSDIWKDIKDDINFKLFTKPFPNTIYWNASKHSGITKKVTLKQIEFRSNEGDKTLSYDDFATLVRELYACMIALLKINLIIISHTFD
jgi:hypothetical protein